MEIREVCNRGSTVDKTSGRFKARYETQGLLVSLTEISAVDQDRLFVLEPTHSQLIHEHKLLERLETPRTHFASHLVTACRATLFLK